MSVGGLVKKQSRKVAKADTKTETGSSRTAGSGSHSPTMDGSEMGFSLFGVTSEMVRESPGALIAAIPEMEGAARESYEAYRASLSDLLQNNAGRWVAYHKGARIGISDSEIELYDKCREMGLSDDTYYVGCIDPMFAN